MPDFLLETSIVYSVDFIDFCTTRKSYRRMSSFKPIDGSKEDFRKYLDRKGVLDAITKVLIKCNSDRPENAIEYLLDNLGERLKDKDTIARLENELNDARNEIEVLKREMNALKLQTASSSSSPSGDAAGPLQPEEPQGAQVTENHPENHPSSKVEPGKEGAVEDRTKTPEGAESSSDPKEPVPQ